MNTTSPAARDERTVAVENASYRWSYVFFTYALLTDVIYRSLFRHEAAWDLLALVIMGGAVCTAYQARQKALAHIWKKRGLLIAGIGAVIGALALVLFLALTRIS